MIRAEGKGITGTVFTLMLFTLFALLSLLLVLYGAGVYTRVAGDMDEGYAMRASLSYVANKLHSADGGTNIGAETVNGVDVLAIQDEFGIICIYFYQNALREQYIMAGADFNPSLGASITELDAFSARVEDGGVRLSAEYEQSERTLWVGFRAMGGDEG